MSVCVHYQVYLWAAEEQVSCPGHAPAAASEGSQPDSGPPGGVCPAEKNISVKPSNENKYVASHSLTICYCNKLKSTALLALQEQHLLPGLCHKAI